MWVKICGNTRLEDCLLAAELGADAIGFIFTESRRRMTAERVRAITAELPKHVETIGVFTTVDTSTIIETIEAAGLSGAQLHGPISYTAIEELRGYFGDGDSRCRLLQVLPWDVDGDVGEAAREAFATTAHELAEDGSADALLLDARAHGHSGGTGRTFDWAAARAALGGVDYRIIAAGGLKPENVAEAIRTLDAWGVDVSSGVESEPGRKSPEKLAAFIAAARS